MYDFENKIDSRGADVELIFYADEGTWQNAGSMDEVLSRVLGEGSSNCTQSVHYTLL